MEIPSIFFVGLCLTEKLLIIKFPNQDLFLNPLSANFTKWLNTLKTIRRLFPTNYLSVFDHFVGLALKGLVTF